MLIHLIVNTEREDGERSDPFNEVKEILEEEVEALTIEVRGHVYTVNVQAAGRDASDAQESFQMRAGVTRKLKRG